MNIERALHFIRQAMRRVRFAVDRPRLRAMIKAAFARLYSLALCDRLNHA